MRLAGAKPPSSASSRLSAIGPQAIQRIIRGTQAGVVSQPRAPHRFHVNPYPKSTPMKPCNYQPDMIIRWIRAILPNRLNAIRFVRKETGLTFKSACAMVDEVAANMPWYRRAK